MLNVKNVLSQWIVIPRNLKSCFEISVKMEQTFELKIRWFYLIKVISHAHSIIIPTLIKYYFMYPKDLS